MQSATTAAQLSELAEGSKSLELADSAAAAVGESGVPEKPPASPPAAEAAEPHAPEEAEAAAPEAALAQSGAPEEPAAEATEPPASEGAEAAAPEDAEASAAKPEAPEQPTAAPPAAEVAETLAPEEAEAEAAVEGAPVLAVAPEQLPASPLAAEAAPAELTASEQPSASPPVAGAPEAAAPDEAEAEANAAPVESEAPEQLPVSPPAAEAAELLVQREVDAAASEATPAGPEQTPASPPAAEAAKAPALEEAEAAAPEELKVEPPVPMEAEAEAEAEAGAGAEAKAEAEAEAAAVAAAALKEAEPPVEPSAKSLERLQPPASLPAGQASATLAADEAVEADLPAEPSRCSQPLASPPAGQVTALPAAEEAVKEAAAEPLAEAQQSQLPATPATGQAAATEPPAEQPAEPPLEEAQRSQLQASPAVGQVSAPAAEEVAEASAPPAAEDAAEGQEPIEDEPRSTPMKDAIEEADGAAPPAQEQPPVTAAAEEAPPTLVLLLVGSADGVHDPQVFRMRCDQPLQRLMATYAKFRQLPSDEGLWLTRAEVDEKLDPTVTAGTLGLADGDRITVHVPAAAGGPREALATAERQQAATADTRAAGPKKRRQPQQPLQRQQRARTEEPVAQEQEEQQPKRPATAFFLWCTENRQAIATEIGTSQVGAVAKACGERWKALAAEEKAPYETRVAEMKAEYDRAMADFVARGGVRKTRRTKKGRTLQASQRQRQLKRPTGGAYGVFLRSQRDEIKRSMAGDAQAGDVAREAERRWQELPEEVKREYQESFDQKMAQYKAALEDLQAEKEEIPASPMGFMRSARVTQGPARGWMVSAWRNARKAVCWKIVEPGRNSRTFRDFKELRRAVAMDIYRTLNQTVKTGLLKRLNEPSAPAVRAVAKAGDFETPKRPVTEQGEEARQQNTGPKAKRPRAETETPDRLDRPILATQAFQLPEAMQPKGEAWTCGCVAHLKRHTRCSDDGDCLRQPALVHLRNSSTTVGRAETCDVVLGSTRTPQMLSRCHAVLSCEDGFTLTDKGSVNGCLVNNRSVKGKCMLKHGDVITFGVQTHNPEFDYVFETRRGGY